MPPACSATTPRSGCFRWATCGRRCRAGAAPREARAQPHARVDRARPRRLHVPHLLDRDVQHLNTVGLGNPTKRTCSTCHGMHMTGMDVANGWMDLGVTNLPWAREEPLNPWNERKPQMPLFKITCKAVGGAARVPRPRHLHAGPRPRARHRQVRRRRVDRDAAVPRAGRARAVLRQRLGRDRCATWWTSTIAASTSATPSQEREDLINFLSAL